MGFAGTSSQHDEHGIASFADLQELAAAKRLAPPGQSLPSNGGLILTRALDGRRFRAIMDAPQRVHLPNPILWHDDEGSSLVIQPPGTGKTAGVIIPNALHYRGSLFVTDIKGEVARASAPFRRANGYEVHIINPFDIPGLGPSSGIDLLSMIDPNDMEDGCAILAVSFFPIEPGDTFWSKSSRILLRALLGHLVERRNSDKSNGVHIGLLNHWLHQGEAVFMEVLESMARSPHPFISGPGHDYQKMYPGQRDGVLAELKTGIAFLGNPKIVKALSSGECNLSRIQQKWMAVYLCVPEAKIKAHPAFVRLVVDSLLLNINEWQTPDIPLLMLLDEFGNCGRMNNVVKALTLIRSARVRAVMIAQAASQLESLYSPQDFKTMFAVSSSQVFSCGCDLHTLQMVTGLLGYETVPIRDNAWPAALGDVAQLGGAVSKGQVLPAIAAAGAFWGRGKQVVSRIKREVAQKDELARLGKQYQIVFLSGHRPVLGRTVRFFQDPEFAERFPPQLIRN